MSEGSIAIFPRVNRPGPEANYSSATCFEVKKTKIRTPPRSSWHSAVVKVPTLPFLPLHVVERLALSLFFIECWREKFTGFGRAGHIAGIAVKKWVCVESVNLGDSRLDWEIILKWMVVK